MGCRFILLRETRKTRRLYAEILEELKNPRRLHEADMQQIMGRIDDMDKRISDALDGLGSDVDALATATENETNKLASIETELRNATSLGDAATTEIADRIAAIRGRIASSTTRLTDSFSAVQGAVSDDGTSGISDGFPAGSGASSGSGSESGGIVGSAGSPTPTDLPAGSGSGAQTDTGDGSGGASTAQPVGDQPQGDAPQDPPQG